MATPDTEWEEQFNKDFGVFKWEESAKEKHTGEILSSTREVFPCEGGYCDMDVSSIKEFITNLLSSRDTYWKERVRNICNEVSRDVDGLPYSQEVKNPSPLSLGDEMVSRDRVQNIIKKELDNLK